MVIRRPGDAQDHVPLARRAGPRPGGDRTRHPSHDPRARPGLFTADPRTTEPARSILMENEVGTVAVDAPLFLVSGTADDRVVIDRVRDLYAQLCAVGQETEVLIVDGATHDSIVPDTADRTGEWLQARLDGNEPTDSCAESPTALPTAAPTPTP